MNYFKNIIKRLFSDKKWVKNRYAIALYKHDFKKFSLYSTTYMNKNEEEYICTRMRILVHVIEKALSLPNPRPGFGKQKILELINYMDKYEIFLRESRDQEVYTLAKSIILNYVEFNEKYGVDLSFIPKKFLNKNNIDLKQKTGTYKISKENFDAKNLNFEKFAYSRHSVRSFANYKIDRERLKDAVRLAQTSPSACNRQPVKVYITDDDEKCLKIMDLHKGTRGFSKPGAFIVLTSDLNLYENEFERNTHILDGGIFLMNMLYSLHYYDIAACPLIWSAEPSNDKLMADLLDIPQNEQIIALVITGEYRNQFEVAKSHKRPLDDILFFS